MQIANFMFIAILLMLDSAGVGSCPVLSCSRSRLPSYSTATVLRAVSGMEAGQVLTVAGFDRFYGYDTADAAARVSFERS